MIDTTQLRDWHARRAGWNEPGTKIPNIWEPTTQATYEKIAERAWWKVDASFKFAASSHPFPPTLDAAASAMPNDFSWQRNGKVWMLFRKFASHSTAIIKDTGDEIHDRYLLAKLAWEQEAGNDGK